MTFLYDDPLQGWRVIAVSAIAHAGDPAEQKTFATAQQRGWTPEIWVGNKKHGNYASLAACNSTGPIPGDHCSSGYNSGAVFVNVGEPWAHLSDDASDAVAKAGADIAAADAYYFQQGLDDPSLDQVFFDALTLRDLFLFNRYQVTTGQERLNMIYLLFKGQRIWRRQHVLEAGITADELFLTSDNYHRPRVGLNGEYLPWDAETQLQIQPSPPLPTPTGPCESFLALLDGGWMTMEVCR